MLFHWRRWQGTDCDTAGLFAIQIGNVVLHVCLRAKHRHLFWGRSFEPYELCAEYFGGGRLFLLVWNGGETLWQSLRDKQAEKV